MEGEGHIVLLSTGRSIPSLQFNGFQMWLDPIVCHAHFKKIKKCNGQSKHTMWLPAMIPSICSKAAANISLASDIIFCSMNLKEKSEKSVKWKKRGKILIKGKNKCASNQKSSHPRKKLKYYKLKRGWGKSTLKCLKWKFDNCAKSICQRKLDDCDQKLT